MRFVAIDFETANSRPDSACQLAMVTVHDGQVVDRQSWLIRPTRLYFSPRNIEIHGIRPEHVEHQPTIEQLWPQIGQRLDGETLIAHNARFDIGVLVASLAAVDIACPNLEFSCTRSLARRAWPGQPRYGLKPLGTWLGIDFKHHDALEDARCCAQIALAVAATCQAESLGDLEKKLRVSRGRYAMGKISSPRALGNRQADATTGAGNQSVDRWGFPKSSGGIRQKKLDCEAIVSASLDQRPLLGKRLVILGSLRGLNAEETIHFVQRLGAECQPRIDSRTQYVIACGGNEMEQAAKFVQDFVSQLDNSQTSSPSTSGCVRVLSERQFLALLPGGKAAVRW